jgi:hypothetical protein
MGLRVMCLAGGINDSSQGTTGLVSASEVPVGLVSCVSRGMRLAVGRNIFLGPKRQLGLQGLQLSSPSNSLSKALRSVFHIALAERWIYHLSIFTTAARPS